MTYDQWLEKPYQDKMAREDKFQDWLDKNRKHLEEIWLMDQIISVPLLDDECADWVADHDEEFQEWAWEQYEQIGED